MHYLVQLEYQSGVCVDFWALCVSFSELWACSLCLYRRVTADDLRTMAALDVSKLPYGLQERFIQVQ